MRKDSKEIQEMVWETVEQIPRGSVATYGEIARVCGLLRQARLVGYALRNLPPASGVPWHRVVNAEGKISFPEGHSHYRQQRELLENEGVLFTGDRIELERYSWIQRMNKSQRKR